MLAARDDLLAGAPRAPYELLMALYGERGNLTATEISARLRWVNKDIREPLSKLVQFRLVNESRGIKDKSWRGYRISRQGCIVATAYASGIAYAMRLHSKMVGLDLVDAWRKDNPWIFAQDDYEREMEAFWRGRGERPAVSEAGNKL